jgi:REP-associated tyrosine transposase
MIAEVQSSSIARRYNWHGSAHPDMYKPRLQRLKWLFTDRPIFFVTTATQGRRHLLAQEHLHQAFREFCRNAAKRGGVVGRYVFMPDHLYLFVAIAPRGGRLSKWAQILEVTLTKAMREQGHTGPFWQKGFFDHVLRSAESYRLKWEYVRRHPVRAGLASRAEDWAYQGEIYQLQP